MSSSPSVTMMTTTVMSPQSSSTPGGGPPPQNANTSIATSASLYLYTFLATLVLLLTVSAAIVIRSFLLRRRHRLMVEEAIRNGTWVPPSPSSRPARVDLTKKPVLWEAYIDEKGAVAVWNPSGGDSGTRDVHLEHWSAEQSRDWDTIKPFSAAYVAKPVEVAAAASNSTYMLSFTNGLGSTPSATSVNHTNPRPVNDASANLSVGNPAPGAADSSSPAAAASSLSTDDPRTQRQRTFLSRVLRVLNPTPAPTSPLPAPVTSGLGPAASGQRGTENAMVEVNQHSTAPCMMHVAVLIAMPTPPPASSSLSASATSGSSSPPVSSGDDEHLLPVLEVGVAEVVMVPSSESSTSYSRGKGGKREMRDSVASKGSDTSEV